MSFDIAAALAAEPVQSDRRCKLQRLLDSIPEDTPDKDQLVTAVVGGDIAAVKAASVMSRLGLRVSDSLISDHRAKRCPCFR